VLSFILTQILAGLSNARDEDSIRVAVFTQPLKECYIVARAAWHKGLDGAVFAIDNDGAPVHEASHVTHATCRVCRLYDAARVDEVLGWSERRCLRSGSGSPVPVQTIETWLLQARGHRFGGDVELLVSIPVVGAR